MVEAKVNFSNINKQDSFVIDIPLLQTDELLFWILCLTIRYYVSLAQSRSVRAHVSIVLLLPFFVAVSIHANQLHNQMFNTAYWSAPNNNIK